MKKSVLKILALCLIFSVAFSLCGCRTLVKKAVNILKKPTETERPIREQIPTPVVMGTPTTEEIEGLITFQPTEIPALPTIPPKAETTATPDTSKGVIKYINSDGINIRSGPSYTSSIITVLNKSKQIVVYSTVNGWSYISYDGNNYGYVVANYISDNDPAKVIPDTSNGVVKYVIGNDVTVRTGTSFSDTKIASLPKGKQVIAYATIGDWTYISYGNNKYGYIITKYLSTTNPINTTPAPTATPTPMPTPTPTPMPTPTPTPTAAPKKSFTEFGVPAAVAKEVDSQTRYLNAAVSLGGFGKVGDTNYCLILTNIELNGQKRFYICYEGTDTNPINVRITSTMPTFAEPTPTNSEVHLPFDSFE